MMKLLQKDEVLELIHGEEITAHDAPLLEAALQEADASNDLELGFQIRFALIHFCYRTGTRAFAAFAWCLGHFQRDSERFADWGQNVLRTLVNMVHCSHCNPDISLEQMQLLHEQHEEHCKRLGYNLRSVYEARWWTALAVGDLEEAARCYDLMRKQRDNDLTHCRACQTYSVLEYMAGLNEHRRAYTLMRQALKLKDYCGTVPGRTHAMMLRSLVILGKPEEADSSHRVGYPLVAGELHNLYHTSFHLAHMRHTGNLTKGVSILEKNLPLALQTEDVNARYRFLLASWLFLRKLAEKKPARKLRLPRNLPGHVADGQFDIERLADFLEQEAADVGARFNQRNRNQSYTQQARMELDY